MGTPSVTTSVFRVGPTAYLQFSARSVALSMFLAISIPVLACLIGSAWDIRWAFIALILIFIVAPMLVGYIYFSKLLTAEAQKALSLKIVTMPADLTDVENSEELFTVTYVSADSENPSPLPPATFSGKSIKQLTRTRKYLIIETDSLTYPLIIPFSALEPENQTPENENQL